VTPPPVAVAAVEIRSVLFGTGTACILVGQASAARHERASYNAYSIKSLDALRSSQFMKERISFTFLI
jgi:hypothetical protein